MVQMRSHECSFYHQKADLWNTSGSLATTPYTIALPCTFLLAVALPSTALWQGPVFNELLVLAPTDLGGLEACPLPLPPPPTHTHPSPGKVWNLEHLRLLLVTSASPIFFNTLSQYHGRSVSCSIGIGVIHLCLTLYTEIESAKLRSSLAHCTYQ